VWGGRAAVIIYAVTGQQPRDVAAVARALRGRLASAEFRFYRAAKRPRRASLVATSPSASNSVTATTIGNIMIM
jgi:hypothetical protein